MCTSSKWSRCPREPDSGLKWRALKSLSVSEWAAISAEHLLRLHLNSCPWNMTYWCRIRDLQSIPFYRFAGKHRDHVHLVDISAGAPLTSSYYIYLYLYLEFSLVITTIINCFWRFFSASRLLRFKKTLISLFKTDSLWFFSDTTSQVNSMEQLSISHFTYYERKIKHLRDLLLTLKHRE